MKMTPLECCQIGATYGATNERNLKALESAARIHAETPFESGLLERVLRQHPEMINGWLRWVEDKRWSPAWYFTADDDHYVVGYFSTDKSECKSEIFEDRYQACAAFIIHELEDFRTLREEKGKW
jgi:hypothetical protein